MLKVTDKMIKLMFVFLSSTVFYVRGFENSCDARTPRQNGTDKQTPRVWSFEMNFNVAPLGELDENTMEVVGFGIDVMRAVCEIANKRCVFAFNNDWKRCWSDETQSSQALDNRWFDACPNYIKTPERALMYAFSRPFVKDRPVVFYVRNNDNIIIQDLMRANDISIGIVSNGFASLECLERNGLKVNKDLARFYNGFPEMFEELGNGEVRMVFTFTQNPDPDQFKHLGLEGVIVSCSNGGNSVMTRKDNVELLEWLNPALDVFIQSEDYKRTCYVWSKIFDLEIVCF